MKNDYGWKDQISWAGEEILSECPSVIAHEYSRVKELLDSQDYGAMMELKDTAESIVKLYTIIGMCSILGKETKTEQDCRFLTEMTTVKLSFGHWAAAARELIDKHLVNEDYIIDIIEGIYDLVDNGNHDNIVSWRNRCIGHGALGYAGTEQFKNDFLLTIDTISSFLEENINSIRAISLQTEEGTILRGINAADSVVTSSKAVYAVLDGKRISLYPFLTICDGKIFFYDWFLEDDNQSSRLNYYWNDSIKSKLEDEITAKIAEIHKEYYISSTYHALEKGNSTFSRADSSYLIELEELLREKTSVKNTLKAKFFETWLNGKINEKTNRETRHLFLLTAPAAYGKTTCVKQFCLKKKPLKIQNTTVRLIHLNDSYNSRTEFILQDVELALTHDANGKALLKSNSELAINRKAANRAQEFAAYLSRVKKVLCDLGICNDRLLLIIDGIDELTEDAKSFLEYIDCEKYLAEDIYILMTSRNRENGVLVKPEAIYNAEDDFKQLMSEYLRKELPNCSQEYRDSILNMDGINFAFIHLMVTVFDDSDYLKADSEEMRHVGIVIKYMKKLEMLYGTKYLKDFLSILYLLAYSDVPLSISDLRMLTMNNISEFAIVGILNDMAGVITCDHRTVNKYSMIHKYLQAVFVGYFRLALKDDFDDSVVHDGIITMLVNASNKGNSTEDIHKLWLVFCSNYIPKDSVLQKKVPFEAFLDLYQKIAFSYLDSKLDDAEQTELDQASAAMFVAVCQLEKSAVDDEKKMLYRYIAIFYASKWDWDTWYWNKVKNNDIEDLLNDTSELSNRYKDIILLKENFEEEHGIEDEFHVTERMNPYLYLNAVESRKRLLETILRIYENLEGGEHIWLRYLKEYSDIQKKGSELFGVDNVGEGLVYSYCKMAEAYLKLGDRQQVKENLHLAIGTAYKQDFGGELYYSCMTRYLITEAKCLIDENLRKSEEDLHKLYKNSSELFSFISGKDDPVIPEYAEYFRDIAKLTYQIVQKFTDKRNLNSAIRFLKEFLAYAKGINNEIQRICRQEIVEMACVYAYRLLTISEVNDAFDIIRKYLRNSALGDIVCMVVPQSEYRFYYYVSNYIYNIRNNQAALNGKYIDKLGGKGVAFADMLLQRQKAGPVSIKAEREEEKNSTNSGDVTEFLFTSDAGKVTCLKGVHPKTKKNKKLGDVYVFNAKYCNTCSYENCPARKHPHMVKVPTIV